MSDDEKPLDPEAARVVARIRRLMIIASATTFLAVAAVLAVIGYRVFHLGGSPPPVAESAAPLPAGAKVIASAVGDGRIVLTVEIAGATELRIYDLNTLKAVGRIPLSPKP
jgi:hypothetical protein